MILTDDYMNATMAEFRLTWRGWQERARAVMRLTQSDFGQAKTSAVLAGGADTAHSAAIAAGAEYTSARCATIMRNFIGRGISAPPKIEPVVLEDGREDQEAQRKLFMMLGGIHNVLDDHIKTTAKGLSWDEQVLKYIFQFGKAIIFPHARYRGGREGDQVEFSAEIIDPLVVMHDFDSWPRRIVTEVGIGGVDAERILKSYAGTPVEEDGETSYPKSRLYTDNAAWNEIKDRNGKYKDYVIFTDFWYAEQTITGDKECRVWHAIRINDITAGMWETDFDHLPQVIQVSHASPSSYQDIGVATNNFSSTHGVMADQILHHCEGFLAPLLKVEADFLQAMSLIMEGAARHLNPGEDITIEQGTKEEDIPSAEYSGPGARRIHPSNVRIGIQETAQAQLGDALRLYFEKSDAEYERLFPNVQFGQSNPGDAGYLQVIKTNAASAVTQESVIAASATGKRVFEELISQWMLNDLKFKVKGWRQNGKSGPQDFEGGDFTSKDFPPQYILNYQIQFDLPPNEAAKAEVARALKEGGWISDREIMVNVFDNPDPDKTIALMRQEKYEASEPVIRRRMLYEMRQEMADLEDAIASASTLIERNGLMLELEYAKKDYAKASGEEPAGQRMPSAPPGFSPSTMPPELGVGTNGDRNAQAIGAVSSYTGGKPRTQVP